MRDFSQANKADYEELDNILSDGQLHVYYNRELPEGCNPKKTRIGFEKDGDIYTLYVDTGIETNADNEDFALWLKSGEIRFVGIEDLIAFFNSIAPLFTDTTSRRKKNNQSILENDLTEIIDDEDDYEDIDNDETDYEIIDQKKTNQTSNDNSQVIDRKKLDEINKARNQNKEVWPEDISNALKEQIYGQDNSIEALAEGISMNCLRNRDKVYVALFLGPTSTGKSETGKLLPEILSKLYGREYGFIKIDCNTYQREHTIQSLLGAPPSYVGCGKATVLDPIRKNPYHVVMFDEIEKAHEDFLVALMEALDTGFLAMADNSPKIDMNKCIIIFTSNIMVDMEEYKNLSEYERNELCKDTFTKHCGKPEISRRIRDYMVFNPISEDIKVDIIIKFTRRALSDYGAKLAHIDENLMADLLKHRTKYGASEIGKQVEKAISRAIIKTRNRNYITGKKINLKGVPEDIVLEVVSE